MNVCHGKGDLPHNQDQFVNNNLELFPTKDLFDLIFHYNYGKLVAIMVNKFNNIFIVTSFPIEPVILHKQNLNKCYIIFFQTRI